MLLSKIIGVRHVSYVLVWTNHRETGIVDNRFYLWWVVALRRPPRRLIIGFVHQDVSVDRKGEDKDIRCVWVMCVLTWFSLTLGPVV